MSELPTNGADKAKLDDGIPLLQITTKRISADETERKEECWEIYEERTEQVLNPYLHDCRRG